MPEAEAEADIRDVAKVPAVVAVEAMAVVQLEQEILAAEGAELVLLLEDPEDPVL
jgi:hypothetical protein